MIGRARSTHGLVIVMAYFTTLLLPRVPCIIMLSLTGYIPIYSGLQFRAACQFHLLTSNNNTLYELYCYSRAQLIQICQTEVTVSMPTVTERSGIDVITSCIWMLAILGFTYSQRINDARRRMTVWHEEKIMLQLSYKPNIDIPEDRNMTANEQQGSNQPV